MFIHTLLETNATDDMDEVVSILKRECSDFLSKPFPLYRGTRNRGDLLTRAPIRADRVSLSKQNVGTVLFNGMIEERFGVPNIRNRCHFAADLYSFADDYGYVYYLFPPNQSKVLYNPHVSDSFGIGNDDWFRMTEDIRSVATENDIKVFVDATNKLDTPGASFEVFRELLAQLSDGARAHMEEQWHKFTHGLINRQYRITRPGEIHKYAGPTEFLIFDSPHTLLVDVDKVKTFFNEDDPDEAFKKLISHIG